VHEWEDACDTSGGADRSGDRCAIRGGSFTHSEDELKCATNDNIARNDPGSGGPAGADVGFRCCWPP
jgi:hypothetical protein